MFRLDQALIKFPFAPFSFTSSTNAGNVGYITEKEVYYVSVITTFSYPEVPKRLATFRAVICKQHVHDISSIEFGLILSNFGGN